jgi:hypothetical protein
VAGFVQQLACCYVRHGYHHYVVGEIPPHKDPCIVDERMIERYELGVSKFVRARRKRAGLPNVQYIRFRRFFVLCATEPREGHRFYEEHAAEQIRHVREQPIAFAGYSIGWHRGADRRWHVSVRIHPERYRSLKAYLIELACRRSVEQVASEFAGMGFEPYAPVRRQLLSLLKAVNRERKVAGLARVPVECLRLRREVVRPFGAVGGVTSAEKSGVGSGLRGVV